MTLVLAVLILAVVVNCCYMIYLIAGVTVHSARAEREPGKIAGLSVFSFFQFLLSTFGISDFAIGTAAYSKLKWVSAKNLPGTVNNAAVIPAVVFPIMMGAATFSLPIGSIQFIRHDSYSRKITIISAVCVTLGVLAAAFVWRLTNFCLPLFLICTGSLIVVCFTNVHSIPSYPCT